MSRIRRLACGFLVATTLGGESPDPEKVLAYARALLRDTVSHLPRYTCTETVNRKYFTQLIRRGSTCDEILGDKRRGATQPTLTASDRLRLDVAIEDSGREVYSWVGAPRLDSEFVAELVGGGPIGTGSFGAFLVDIFANRGATFAYQKTSAISGNELFEYRFHVPSAASHYQLEGRRQGRFIGYDGTFWLDPKSSELRRLSVRTDELPLSSGACEATTTVDFAPLRIGTEAYLLPRESQLSFVGRQGNESENTTTYSGCHEYRGESVVHFDDIDSGARPSGNTSKIPNGLLPAGIKLELALQTTIDPDTAAAGDPVTASVPDRIVDRATGKTLVPANTTARGRIIRLEQSREKSASFLVAMEFRTVEYHGKTVQFAAKLIQASWPARRVAFGFSNSPITFQAHTTFPSSGTFLFLSPKPGYVVPRGYKSKWITVKQVKQ